MRFGILMCRCHFSLALYRQKHWISRPGCVLNAFLYHRHDRSRQSGGTVTDAIFVSHIWDNQYKQQIFPMSQQYKKEMRTISDSYDISQNYCLADVCFHLSVTLQFTSMHVKTHMWCRLWIDQIGRQPILVFPIEYSNVKYSCSCHLYRVSFNKK